ncbi:MAG: ATP-binding protein [Candidatus Staskawiczbacteria bacterium]|nr:ATP-binding protein [Candidatus Staskawiczbacteria bacterium]
MLPVFTISCFITAISSLIFGCFVVLENFKAKTNKLWFLTTFSIALWSFSLGMEISSPNYSSALIWNKILNVGAIFIPIFYYHFTILFLEDEKNIREKIILIIGYFFALFFVLSNFFTKFFVKGVPPGAGFNYWIEVGPLYYLFFGLFASYLIWSGFLFIQRRKGASLIQKRQIDYILLALLFGAGGGITNFLPQLFNVYPFGNYFVVLYVIFISYAALKHHLFNGKVIAAELLTFSIWVLLLIKALLSESLQDFLLNGGILLIVIVFGILLIRSAIREVRQREEIEKLAEEIKRAYEVEKKAKEDLESLSTVKNQFLMTIQHHLRTPLTSMRGYADLLLSGTFGKVPKKIEEVIRKFETSTTGLIKMVNDFLDITQFQLGKQVVSLKDGVDLSPILEEIIGDMKLEADKKGINLALEKPEGACIIKADESKLKAALVNIFDNSVKYTKVGSVKMMLKSESNKVRIEIEDTGMGIAKERLAKLFDNTFERTEEAKKTFSSGRGIGLYLSGQIIKAHNGKIWAESEGVGKGSTFIVELPV